MGEKHVAFYAMYQPTRTYFFKATVPHSPHSIDFKPFRAAGHFWQTRARTLKTSLRVIKSKGSGPRNT